MEQLETGGTNHLQRFSYCNRQWNCLPRDVYRIILGNYLTIRDLRSLDKAVECYSHASSFLVGLRIACSDTIISRHDVLWLYDKNISVDIVNVEGKICEYTLFMLTRMHSIKSIRIRGAYVFDKDRYFANSFIKLKSKRPEVSAISNSLQILEIDKECFEIPRELIFTLIKNSPLLHSFTSSKYDHEIIIKLTKYCPLITSIHSRSREEFRNSSLGKIYNAFPNLEMLTIFGSHRLMDTSIISLGKSCCLLKSLSISNAKYLTNASIITLSEYCHNLESISFTFCWEIQGISISILFINNKKTLKKVHLEFTRLITDKCIITLAKNCYKLESLGLRMLACLSWNAVIVVA